jgi:hypothetical protein
MFLWSVKASLDNLAVLDQRPILDKRQGSVIGSLRQQIRSGADALCFTIADHAT